MDYFNLKSILGSKKKRFSIESASDSFFLTKDPVQPYIEPRFKKEDFPTEKPAILLVSAIGASGKTTTARMLAYDTGLPILDLAKHKPVGDNTLTGILTSSYRIEDISAVLSGLRSGSHGVIIDGIDEGRSKTTEQGFEAFLDDLSERCKGAHATTIVMLGRSQVLISAWCYLKDQKADVGIIQIDPFDLEQAKSYINAYVPEENRGHKSQYINVRDIVLSNLRAAFVGGSAKKDEFLAFIGYPPVLDAIATLLRTESNYHRIEQGLKDNIDRDLEVRLLIRISDLLLERERKEKALPNFIEPITNKAASESVQSLRETLYNSEEQCARVLARVLDRTFLRKVVPDDVVNEEYEKALASWVPEHPFLDDKRVRNAVFEAVSISRCALSEVDEYRDIAISYSRSKMLYYHLFYIMDELAKEQEIDVRFFNVLIQSCSELLGTHEEIQVSVRSNGDYVRPDELIKEAVELEITIFEKEDEDEQRGKRTFLFRSDVLCGESYSFGPYLVNSDIFLPNCKVVLEGTPSLEVTGACRVVAREVNIDTPEVVVRGAVRARRVSIDEEPGAFEESGLFIDTNRVTGSTLEVTPRASIVISCLSHQLQYPLAKYVSTREESSLDSEVEEKYRRLRRILVEFRSHSRGRLAKYRDKIEHTRTLQNQLGERVLQRLLEEGILTSDNKFYYVSSGNFSEKLGVTWTDLKKYKKSELLLQFLDRV